MKKLLIYSISLVFLLLSTAAGCDSNSSDPTPKATLGLVGGRWELETSVVIISKNGKERARVEKGPGLGYIFNADGSYDGCAMTVSDWSYPTTGTPSNAWNCTSKGGGGTWKYTEQGSGKDPQTGVRRTEGKLTLYPKTTPSSVKELTYVVYLTSNDQMAWNKDEKDPDEPDLITLSTFIWKLKK